MNPMNRRELFKSAACAAAGAGLLAADPEAIWGANAARQTPKSKLLPLSFIETRDQAGLFYRDWGTGKPVVFVHGWAVNSDLWQYQMATSPRMVCDASATIAEGTGAPAIPAAATISTRFPMIWPR